MKEFHFAAKKLSDWEAEKTKQDRQLCIQAVFHDSAYLRSPPFKSGSRCCCKRAGNKRI